MLNFIKTCGQVELQFRVVNFTTRPFFSHGSVFVYSLDGSLCVPRPGLIRGGTEERVASFGNQTPGRQTNSLTLSRFNTCSLSRDVFSAFLNRFIVRKFRFSKVRI